MTVALMGKLGQTCAQGESHGKMKADIRGVFLQAKDQHRLPENHQKQGQSMEQILPHNPQKKTTLPTLWSPTSGLQTVRQYICIVKLPVCGTLLWQPWQTKPAIIVTLVHVQKKKNPVTSLIYGEWECLFAHTLVPTGDSLLRSQELNSNQRAMPSLLSHAEDCG